MKGGKAPQGREINPPRAQTGLDEAIASEAKAKRGTGSPDQRLDAQAIACQNDLAASFVDDRKREHPVETRKDADPPFLVAVEDDLGVALCAEAMTMRLELVTENGVVVDLAVERQMDVVPLVRHRVDDRLRQVDDGQPRVDESSSSPDHGPARVGAARRERPRQDG